MSEDIKVAARRGVERMKEWYKDAQLPNSPLTMNGYSTILDVEKYVYTQLGIIEHYAETPDAKPFMSAYFRLFDLKQFIEREQSK